MTPIEIHTDGGWVSAAATLIAALVGTTIGGLVTVGIARGRVP